MYLGPPGTDTGPCGASNGDNELWSYLPEAQGALRKAMELREGLRPYVHAQSAATAATGMPMVLPLALAFPEDAQAQQLQAEAAYMFGPTYLVQPVTVLGARTATVYLPAGAQWQYFFNASMQWQGGQLVTVEAPLNEFPLFQRV